MLRGNLLSFFFDDYRLKQQSWWFKRLLYIFLFIKTVYWFIYYGAFFGAESIVLKNPSSAGSFRDLAYLVYYSKTKYLAFYFLLALCGLSLLNLFNRKIYFISDFVTWFLFLNLSNNIYPTLTSGDFLIQQLLIFNCFVVGNDQSSERKGSFSILKKFFHNCAILAIMIQVCLVYTISGLSKLADKGWLSGQAVIDISKIRSFSLYSFLTYRPELEFIFTCLNYIVLFYQLLFPLVIWLRRIKKYVLIVGILMHVYIALVMGLVEFGLAMLLCYTIFWPDKRKMV